MKSIQITLLGLSLMLMPATFQSCTEHHHHDHEAEEHHHDEHEGEEHHHDEHDEHEGEEHPGTHAEEGSSVLTVHIHDHEAELLGIRPDTISPTAFSAAICVSGEVKADASESSVVTAPTSGTLVIPNGITVGARVGAGATIANIDGSKVSGADVEGANAATLRSTREDYERMDALRKKGLVTASQLNAAREAYERAQALTSKTAATRRATAPIAGVITSMLVANGAYVQAGEPIATVARSSRLTLTANLPDRYASFVPQISGARIKVPGTDRIIDISDYNPRQLTSSSQSTSANAGFIPVAMSFDNPGISGGSTAAQVYLLGTPRSGAIAVPSAAIVEDQGAKFVYRITGPEHYMKTPVTVGQSNGSEPVDTGAWSHPQPLIPACHA